MRTPTRNPKHALFPLALAVVFAHLDCEASIQPAGVLRERELSPVVQWADETGKLTVIRANVAAALGLGPADLVVRQLESTMGASNMTNVFAVAVTRLDTLLIGQVHEPPGNAIFWLTSTSGELRSAARFSPSLGAESVAVSAEQVAAFAAAKRFLMTEKRRFDATQRQSSNSTPVDSTMLVPTSGRRIFGSERHAIAAAPWVLIGVAVAFWLATQRSSRT
ncbi:MAG: hypothetical protein ACR2ID_01975 [Chthoniobacterales bacterium]